ncbi:MAG: DUF503 domain-containing protein [Candidatus Omnitrophica bacterium]|nr:DUF503 domain-containing protein [Candidatus Omnitrophota bacterium]
MIEAANHIGVLYIRVFIPQSQSLKDKRMVLKSLKDKIRNEFNASVAELDKEDKWQTATLGACMIGPDKKYIDNALRNILSLAERHYPLEICETVVEFC